MTIACDKGAPCTFVSRTFYERHLSNCLLKDCEIPYKAYGGKRIKIIGECEANITFRGTNRPITVVVTNEEAPPFLGRNFLRCFGFQLTLEQINVISPAIDNTSYSAVITKIKNEFSSLFDGQ